MKKIFSIVFIITLIFSISLNSPSRADVKQESTTTMEFKGTLGTMMKLFGGNRPVSSITYVSNDLLRTDNLDKKNKVKDSNIIDLENELFININHQKKYYTKMTFAEWQDMMKSQFDNADESHDVSDANETTDVKVEFDVNVEKTGEFENIAGIKAEKIILTLKIRGKANEQNEESGTDAATATGEMTVTSTNWMSDDVEGYEEIENFYKKMAEKMEIMPGKMNFGEMFKKISMSNPQLGEAMQKLSEEMKEMKGFAMKTHTVYETQGTQTVESSESGEEETTNIPTSLGGLFKGLGSKMAKNAQTDDSDSDSNVIMESTTEITNFENSDLDASVFEIPANYKEIKISEK